MIFDAITIFPEIFNSFIKESLIARAQKKGLIKIRIHNLRKWTKNRHQTVDDRPFGGGLGMVLKVEPIFRAVQSLKNKKLNTEFPFMETRGKKSAKKDISSFVSSSTRRTKFSSPIKDKKQKLKNKKTAIILFTPRGKKFNQQIAYKLSKLNQIIMICGRYEGVDERVAKYIADMELSIGDYDLMGGELPAQVLIETVARLIPGVLGKPELLKERITREKGFIECPQYTRPPEFFPGKFWRARPKIWRAPKVLLSGHHKKIEEWRKKKAKEIGK